MQAEVATAAAKTILMGGPSDEVAAELFELVGDGGFEATQELVTYRCNTSSSWVSVRSWQIGAKLCSSISSVQTRWDSL